MTNLDQLRQSVDQLQQAFDRDFAHLSEQWPNEEMLVRTTDGRFILLDALTALVNARTALARAEVES